MKVLSKLMVGAALSALATSAAVAQITVGTPNTVQPNCLPFGCGVGHNQVQQIYASTLFSGPVNINAITFYNSLGTGTFGVGTYNLFFSSTTASPTAPGTVAANVTGAETAFATLVSTGQATGSVITFTGSPFFYNPNSGNLLLDIKFSPFGFNFSQSFFDVVRSPDVGRATDVSAFLGSDTRGSYGLVTTFDVSQVAVVPEPTTVALMGAGLFAVAFAARRRRA